MLRSTRDVAPFLVALALTASQPAAARWLSCHAPEDVHATIPQLLEDVQGWTMNDKFIVDGDVEFIEDTSNVFTIRARSRTDDAQ